MYSSDTTAPYDFHTTATYQCDEGYMLDAGSPRDVTRACDGLGSSPTGMWNGTDLSCSGTCIYYIMCVK